MTDEEKASAEERIREANHKMISEIKNKSDDDFEKNLVYITSGTLILSLTFIEKIAPLADALWIWTLITAWGLLTISLLINLISHIRASEYSLQYIQEYGQGATEDEVNVLILRNNKKISTMNYRAVYLLIAGLGFLIVYCSINAWHMSSNKKTSVAKDGAFVDEGKFGRTTPTMIVNPNSTKPVATTKPATDTTTKSNNNKK